jgi:outer membrane protein assembly factor BamB
LAAWLWLVPTLAADPWPHYAGNPAHTGTAARATRDLTTIRWTATPLTDEEYVWHSSPVVHAGRVLVNACYYVDGEQAGNRVIAYAVNDGQRLWATPIEIGEYDSWSSPAIDTRNRTVLIGSGFQVYALALENGEVAWQRQLDRSIVNASPVVTADLSVGGTPANRVLVTDYSGYETSGALHAISVDPFDPQGNPYEPGEIVWSTPLPGTSGNTPAYADGTVFVTSVGGLVQALDARDGAVLWETDVDLSGYPQYSGFYSGVAVRNGYAYAASCVFYGSGNNSGLFKFDTEDGEIVWVAPCERTDSIPVVTADGHLFLSAGLDGYGSAVKIQAFQDHGDSCSALWDTHADAGAGLIVGGWTHQPAHARGYLYVGTPPGPGAGFYGAYTDLYVLDTAATPADPDFIVAHLPGAGGSPALADGTLYSFGQAGLFALDPAPACLADLDGDGLVSLSDLATLLGAYGSALGDADFDSDADLNRDNVVDLSDLAELLGAYGAECL